jgi:hypothetical protein
MRVEEFFRALIPQTAPINMGFYNCSKDPSVPKTAALLRESDLDCLVLCGGRMAEMYPRVMEGLGSRPRFPVFTFLSDIDSVVAGSDGILFGYVLNQYPQVITPIHAAAALSVRDKGVSHVGVACLEVEPCRATLGGWPRSQHVISMRDIDEAVRLSSVARLARNLLMVIDPGVDSVAEPSLVKAISSIARLPLIVTGGRRLGSQQSEDLVGAGARGIARYFENSEDIREYVEGRVR